MIVRGKSEPSRLQPVVMGAVRVRVIVVVPVVLEVATRVVTHVVRVMPARLIDVKGVRALSHGALVWAIPPFVLSATRLSKHNKPCANSPRKRMARP